VPVELGGVHAMRLRRVRQLRTGARRVAGLQGWPRGEDRTRRSKLISTVNAKKPGGQGWVRRSEAHVGENQRSRR